MSIHVIVVCHKIFADRKQNCDTEYAKKSFCWPEVFDRMNGYLGITRNADGSSRYNDAKLAEIAERRSM